MGDSALHIVFDGYVPLAPPNLSSFPDQCLVEF